MWGALAGVCVVFYVVNRGLICKKLLENLYLGLIILFMMKNDIASILLYQVIEHRLEVIVILVLSS